MKSSNLYTLKLSLFSLCIFTLFACSTQKDTATSRGMQNLTAHYNYIYNANLALLNHQTELNETYSGNYDQILPVYLGPEVYNTQLNASLNIKSMDEIIKKSQVIILEKNFSKYVDEAYILLGKANFFNGNYYTASEYLDYAAKTYRTNINSYTEALTWKARSLMQIDRISSANTVLDSLESVVPLIKIDKNLAEPFATMAQMSIYQNNNEAAISYIKDAIKSSKIRQNRIRWTYILAQLYEKQKNYPDALIQYRKVQNSNAPFEMYFNAKLRQIKLNSEQGKVVDKKASLLALLKDDKNTEYSDQVYFQIAESLNDGGAFEEAQANYLTAIQNSTSNQYRKGLSYLRIAELNFKSLRNYLKAKSYYDSTVNTLPKSFPGYETILKKSSNLQYLTQRYETISLEDTLQAIAKLPETERQTKLQNFVNPVSEKTVATTGTSVDYNYQPLTNRNPTPQSSFYFSNLIAVDKGYSEFKKKWGNRKLEANWRQSIRTSAQATSQDIAGAIAIVRSGADTLAAVPVNIESLIQQYTASLPVSEPLLAASNQKIIDSYYEIASFYLQEINDPKEAEDVYLTLIRRFPINNHLDAALYSLYLINKAGDLKQSTIYKNQILLQFPNSVYAKTITDPSFSVRQSEAEVAVNKQYNKVFDQYLKKDFPSVILSVNEAEKLQGNYLSPQLAYLKAIAIGRSSPVDSLLTTFNRIILLYPNDQVITPLTKEHLEYINQHLEEFRRRSVALVDFDPNEPPYIGNSNTMPLPINQPSNVPVQNTNPPIIANNPVTITPIPTAPTLIAFPGVKTDGTFSDAASTVYYFIVDVEDASLTLSSSRFGIGQFNRGNFSGSNLRHRLKEFDNDQLIYVGNFSSFEDANNYANGIGPQLKQIMKVPVSIYTSFIISKENFDKLNSKALLDKYLEFYKNSY
ncbi:tetratricopeptide repeat protein [Pedobacter sp. JCM 36344]|uniref:type IX secretion system periplasmic lipoprotein PorW/SprE n=1 Tax=Pedobacter sp. JCM 36344 TaxID=3374280 RepID=UPI0039797B3A